MAASSSGDGGFTFKLRSFFTISSKVIDLIRNISKETEVTLQINEAYQLFMVIQRTKKIKGDIAEVGVYKGGSAKIICEAKGNKALYLFNSNLIGIRVCILSSLKYL